MISGSYSHENPSVITMMNAWRKEMVGRKELSNVGDKLDRLTVHIREANGNLDLAMEIGSFLASRRHARARVTIV